MNNKRRRYTCTKCKCWFGTARDYKHHLTIHLVKPKTTKKPYTPPDPVLFPYSEHDKKPRLVSCKNSGVGNIWCYPETRKKYDALCKTCYMNPDIKSEKQIKIGLDLYE